VPLSDGRTMSAVIAKAAFYDPQGTRQNV
jgi:hypothetical protein